MKKLQNSFNDFLPQNYLIFHRSVSLLSANQAVVAELLRICCEGDDVKAIKLAFERILGKPEKVIVIKRTLVRTIFPDASKKSLTPVINDRVQDETSHNVTEFEDKLIIDEANAPGVLLRKMLDKIGEEGRDYAYHVVDKKDQFTVAEVMVANLYAIAMRGANLAAITMLFDYLDGAVADVIRLDGEDTILLESYADIAPYEAQQDDDGVWYIQTEAVK
jgi:hypothetical protein